MSYIPNQGDIVYLDFDPQAGHEQKGRRPALVVSNFTYNKLTRMALVCPITNTNRHFPLHVALNSKTRTSGFIMCEQVKALDINFRNAEFFEHLPADVMQEVFDIIYGIIEIE
ncbi:type II toxin-antitoxin system PemK/MazF family toxin [Fusibacter ferrireducens]|uniref:Type II toxin-antitoxin system PemK/MazF family toxin n=1 Tax=Fusibacter ferrireducens TaxID=2785058 RepID=A0ABS0A040_9FIRM|nr:type II toxin-antitoxin system PemK/MazF family toxin [Fusibacter ferrireducens]MBF4696070.1 type II toxin-antitoxin system PemK/MazF family toxin [Fusibacter ferrireducens]